MDIPTGITPIKVVPVFTWPDIEGTICATIWGAMVNSEMTEVIGELAEEEIFYFD